MVFSESSPSQSPQPPSGPVVFALFDGVLLRKRFQVGFCEPADRFVAPSHRVCYSGEHIVGFRTDQSCVRKQKNNADQILPSGGKVVLLLCHPLGFLRVLTVAWGGGGVKTLPLLLLSPKAWVAGVECHTIATWLILPVVICLSQRLSHACLSINNFIP